LNLLLIEDDARLCSEYRSLLEGAGHRVALVEDGLQALAWLDEHMNSLPDLILLDPGLPVLDGAMFRREQLRCKVLAEIPVVVMPSAGNRRSLPRSLAFCARVDKEAPLEELLHTVEAFRSDHGAVAAA